MTSLPDRALRLASTLFAGAAAVLPPSATAQAPAATELIVPVALAPVPGGGIACSPDGELLATAARTRLLVRRLADGGTVREWPLGVTATQVVFTPDGTRVAVAAGDGALRLFDVASGRGPRTLFCGAASVTFRPDGGALVIARDGTVTALAAASLAVGPGAGTSLRLDYERWRLPPRHQGQRGTCSVFTVAAAFEWALARAEDRATPLSEEYLNWASNDAIAQPWDGGFFHDILRGFEAHGICPLDRMPYRPDFDAALRPSDEARAAAAALRARPFAIHWINPWKPQAGLDDAQMAAIRAVLDRGWPVCLGSSHSVLAIGWQEDPAAPGGGVFAIRDSGAGAFGTLTFEHVREKVGDVFWVELPAAGH
jgi:hypothetical protein